MNKETLKLIAIVLVASVIGGFVAGLVGNNQPVLPLGGSTSDSWSVGGNLSVTGTTALTGAITASGETAVQGLTQGGGVLTFTATTTQDARTLTEAELIASNIIEIAVAQSPALVLTLPATSTMTTLLPNAGDMREWFIDNQQAAATTTTITAGAGIDLIAVTTNDDVIDGQEVSRLTCYRKADTDVYCLVSELLKAD